MANYRLLFVFALCTGASTRTVSVETIDACIMSNLSDCFEVLVTNLVLDAMPNTLEGVRKQCRSVPIVRNCFGKYARECTSGAVKSTFYAIGESYQKYYAEYCKPDSPLVLQYMSNASCASSAYLSPAMDSILNDFVVSLNHSMAGEYSHRFIRFGCAFQRWYEDTLKLYEMKCGKEIADSYTYILRKAYHGIPWSFAAHLSPDSEKCKNLNTPRGHAYTHKENNFIITTYLHDVFKLRKKRNGF